MKEQNIEESSFYNKLILFTEKYKKPLLYAGALVVVLVSSITLYNTYVLEPKKEEAEELIAVVQEFFQNDSFERVIHGSFGTPGAVEISNQFGRTQSGNLAHYYAGVSYLKTGEFDNAIMHLKKFNPNNDKLIGSLAYACIGDAYVEKSDYTEALKYYLKAVHYNDANELTTPVHFDKAVHVMIELKQFEQALELAEKLLKNPDLPVQFKYNLKKFKGYIESLSGKYTP